MGNKIQKTVCECFNEKKETLNKNTTPKSKPDLDIQKNSKSKNKSGKVNQHSDPATSIHEIRNGNIKKAFGDNEVATQMYKATNIDKKVTLNDFLVERVIGRGAFGKVLLVKKEVPNGVISQRYAMKIIRKKDIYKNEMVENIILEKYILSQQKHPFIVDLKFAFQTSNKIYLIMEYISGGELFKLLRKVKRFSQEAAKFYISETLLAIEFLHRKMNIIYRDIKPENILLTDKGHVKITDFGLSKKNDGKAYTIVGTIEYLAPEVLTEAGHSIAVDYWGLGILLFEMLAGYPPFTAKNRNFDEIEKLIIQNKPVFPDYFSKESVDLIKKLTDSDPEKRLGVISINDIKDHSFFKGVNWSNLLNLKITPPYNIKNNLLNYLYGDNKKWKEIQETLCNSQLPNLDGITYNYDTFESNVVNGNIYDTSNSTKRQSDFEKIKK